MLFLDEPTTGLDPTSRQKVWDTVRELLGDGVTVLLTTQYLEEADALADTIVVIDHGQGHRGRHPERTERGKPERPGRDHPQSIRIRARWPRSHRSSAIRWR